MILLPGKRGGEETQTTPSPETLKDEVLREVDRGTATPTLVNVDTPVNVRLKFGKLSTAV